MFTIHNFFVGKWRIAWMEAWDADYYDMEVPAYFKIIKDGGGNFQFGLVQGEIDGRVDSAQSRFEFTWEGNDEGDQMSGSGWLEREGVNTLKGELRIHRGDSSLLKLKKMK